MTQQLDLEAFEERAAIMEFCGGMSRFEAETRAAEVQNFKRWEAMNAIRQRNSQKARDRGAPDARISANHMPGMQPAPAKETRPVSQRDVQN
jgi:hypothetical protein